MLHANVESSYGSWWIERRREDTYPGRMSELRMSTLRLGGTFGRGAGLRLSFSAFLSWRLLVHVRSQNTMGSGEWWVWVQNGCGCPVEGSKDKEESERVGAARTGRACPSSAPPDGTRTRGGE